MVHNKKEKRSHKPYESDLSIYPVSDTIYLAWSFLQKSAAQQTAINGDNRVGTGTTTTN